jgi:hypothetical protein
MAASHSDSPPPTFANALRRGDMLVDEIEDALAHLQNSNPDVDFEYVVEVHNLAAAVFQSLIA